MPLGRENGVSHDPEQLINEYPRQHWLKITDTGAGVHPEQLAHEASFCRRRCVQGPGSDACHLRVQKERPPECGTLSEFTSDIPNRQR